MKKFIYLTACLFLAFSLTSCLVGFDMEEKVIKVKVENYTEDTLKPEVSYDSEDGREYEIKNQSSITIKPHSENSGYTKYSVWWIPGPYTFDIDSNYDEDDVTLSFSNDNTKINLVNGDLDFSVNVESDYDLTACILKTKLPAELTEEQFDSLCEDSDLKSYVRRIYSASDYKMENIVENLTNIEDVVSALENSGNSNIVLNSEEQYAVFGFVEKNYY